MEEIELRAETVLAELPEYIWSGDRPPIPIHEIADSHFGLHVRKVSPAEMRAAPGCPDLGDDETLSGLLLPSLGEIWVNSEEAGLWPERERFTIAHELGHHVLHATGQQTLFCRRPSVDPERGTGRPAVAAAGDRAGGEHVRRRAADAGRDDRALLPQHRPRFPQALRRVRILRRRDEPPPARGDLSSAGRR